MTENKLTVDESNPFSIRYSGINDFNWTHVMVFTGAMVVKQEQEHQ